MNETRTINLNGLVYHIDYDAYQILRDYLHDIELRLPQDDRQEVMTDIEARIAELLQKALFAKNIQVVNIEIVNSVKSQIGAPSEFGPNRRPKVKIDKSQNSGCGRILSITLKVILILMALPILGTILTILFAVIMTLCGLTFGIGSALPFLSELAPFTSSISPAFTAITILCLLFVFGLPIVMLIHTIIIFMRTRRGPKARFWWTTLILWVLSLIGLGTLTTHFVTHSDINNVVRTIDRWDDMDGTFHSEARELESFHAIEVYGAAQINLSQSLDQQIVVNAHDFSLVQTEVREGVLYINVPTNPYTPMILDISVPTLSSIRAVGAASIDLEPQSIFTTDTLTLDLSGAAEVDMDLQVAVLNIDAKGAASVELTGTANSATITLAGAGEIDAEDFLVQTMHINCAGASEADIHVVRELWAQAAGASKISYMGNPTIKQNMAVGGSVIKRDL